MPSRVAAAAAAVAAVVMFPFAAAALAALIAACAAARAVGCGRRLVLRARWAWRCRGHPPVPGEGSEARLTRGQEAALAAIAAGRRRTARPERTRT